MLKSLPPLLSFCSSFILSPFLRSVRSSFMHLLLRVTVMNDTPQWDHSSICSSLFISLFLSLAKSLTFPVLSSQIYCITLGRVDAKNELKSAQRNVLFPPESGGSSHYTVPGEDMSFPLSDSCGLFSGKENRKKNFELFLLNLESVIYFLYMIWSFKKVTAEF